MADALSTVPSSRVASIHLLLPILLLEGYANGFVFCFSAQS